MNFEAFKDIVTGEFPGITDAQLEQFRVMEGLYRDWNSRINVISRKDIDGFYEHHVLHSLAIASYWRRTGIICSRSAAVPPCSAENAPQDGLPSPLDAHMYSVLDLGTGGGFPGIPLAVMCPEIQFTLCDSIGKKVRVAGEVAAALGLTNVTTVNARAESLPDCYDFVVSRAVTTLDNFYPWVKDRFRYSIFYLKGGDVNEEIMQLMARQHLKKGSVHTWKVDNWLSDEYFQEKFVIQIEKDYLCSPIVGKI